MQRGRSAAARPRGRGIQTSWAWGSGKGMGVAAPEREGVGSARRQDDMQREAFGDLIQNLGSIYRLGPRNDRRQVNSGCLRVAIELQFTSSDFCVERFGADAQ